MPFPVINVVFLGMDIIPYNDDRLANHFTNPIEPSLQNCLLIPYFSNFQPENAWIFKHFGTWVEIPYVYK